MSLSAALATDATIGGDSLGRYPQLVGSDVENRGQHVNDTSGLLSVHRNVAHLWFAATRGPQVQAPSVLGCMTLSPVSTHAMTTAVPR